MVRASRVLLRLGGFLIVTGALAWGCGGSVASFPDGGGADASVSSSGSGSSGGSGSGSSSGITSSSSGGSSGSGSGSSSASSSGGSASSSGSGSSSSSGSGGSSGSSGSSSGGTSGSSSGSGMCGACTSDPQCQVECPPVMGGTNCCDQGSGVCYATVQSTCPLPPDAGCPTTWQICPVNDAGTIPPNPSTGSVGCDGCIECSCGYAWCACAADSSDIDSGTPMGCVGYVSCVNTCVSGDAGVQPCTQQCAGAYTMQQAQEGDALLMCLVANCATASTCGM